jgi:CRISPR-associated protein Csm2
MNSSYGGNRNHGRSGGGNNYQNRPDIPAPDVKVTETSYVDDAEKVILYLKESKKLITTTQLRNILAMAADILNQILTSENKSDSLEQELVERIDYLRVRCAYAAGRDKEVDKFLQISRLNEQIKKIGNSKKRFMLFYHYMEALVAYNRFHGGSDI